MVQARDQIPQIRTFSTATGQIHTPVFHSPPFAKGSFHVILPQKPDGSILCHCIQICFTKERAFGQPKKVSL